MTTKTVPHDLQLDPAQRDAMHKELFAIWNALDPDAFHCFAGTDRTLLHMFDDANMLDRMNDDVGVAATTFYNNMQAFSAQVSSRTFGADGLSQGMPFVWQALDPNVAPYSLTV